MELKTYFTTLCRQLGVHLKADSPAIKKLVTGKNGKNENGTVARYDFGGFYMDIYYIENMKGGIQQLIWISFFFDGEPSIIFSLYDILSVTEPDNFNCYTFSFVDSKELMKDCFDEFSELLKRILPLLFKLAENGVEKNRLIEKQKQKVNEYFGDNVIEASNLLKNSGEKILSMMFYNFFQYQIDIFLMGSPVLFFKGKEEKALKALKKAKYRSIYEDSLLEHLENGGKTTELSKAAKNASMEKGSSRQGTDAKGYFKILLYTLLFAVPVSVVMAGLFALLTFVTSTNSLFIFGIKENLLFIPFFSLIPALTIALNIHLRKKNKNNAIHTPELPKKARTILKYFTIFAESVTLIAIFASVNSTTVLKEENFLYSTEFFPTSRNTCEYSSVDYVAIVNGYTYDGKFQEDPHIVIVTKSGTVIDLYNSTFFSVERFEKETKGFLKEKGIEIKQIKTTD